MHGVFDSAGLRRTRASARLIVAFQFLSHRRLIPDVGRFQSSIPSLHIPLSTLRLRSCGRPRMTRGQDGSLLLFLYDSFIHYSMPVYPDARKESTMPDNPNMEHENAPLDAEDWENALAPYAGHPGAALQLACHLFILQAYLKVEPVDVEAATAAIDRGIEVLFPFTQFHGVCHDMYIKVIGGELTLEEEEMLKKLGLKF